MQWKTDGRQYAQSFHSNPLTFRVKKHQSVLIRKLGDSEQRWQKNKVRVLLLCGCEGRRVKSTLRDLLSFMQVEELVVSVNGDDAS